MPSSITAKRLLPHLPMITIVTTMILGAVFLQDYISLSVLRDNREALLAYRDAHFGLLAALFITAYIAIVTFSLPGATIASITGGFLFGLWMGSVFNVIAATLGACLVFKAAQMGFGRSLAARMEASDGNLKRLKDGLHKNEISVLFLMRLVPVVPFFIANIVPALIGVRFRNYALTTALGIIPGAVVYTSIGAGINEVFARGEAPNLSILWDPYVIGPILGLAALAAAPMVLNAIRPTQGDIQ